MLQKVGRYAPKASRNPESKKNIRINLRNTGRVARISCMTNAYKMLIPKTLRYPSLAKILNLRLP
jgi:hypothetical protein